MIVYESDLKKNAISSMENCVAFISQGNMRCAHGYRGKASVYEEMLEDEGINLIESNAYYAEMIEQYREAVKKEIRGGASRKRSRPFGSL